MRVRDVMIPVVESVTPDTTLRDAVERIQALDLDPLPVSQDGRVVGVVTHADLQATAAADGLGAGMKHVREVMTTDVVCCNADEAVVDAARRLSSAPHERIFGRLPVVDGRGTLLGVVSADALRKGLLQDAPNAVDAVEAVESIDSLVSFEDDRVDYMSDESFPASDPPPAPTRLAPADGDEE